MGLILLNLSPYIEGLAYIFFAYNFNCIIFGYNLGLIILNLTLDNLELSLLFGIDPFLLAAIVPIKTYFNAEADKSTILKENKNKSGIYK